MARTLELTINLHEDSFDVEVYEPESGEFFPLRDNPFSPDEHPEFDKAIGQEIYSWLTLWKDEEDEQDG